LRTLAGFLFLGRRKIESPGKSKASPNFQKCRWRFKIARENGKLRPEIQIATGTPGVPPEIRHRRRRIEKLRRKFKLSLKIPIAGRTANFPDEDLYFRAHIQFFSGTSTALPENSRVQRKKKKFRWKIAILS
jgi:hypothetical protein